MKTIYKCLFVLSFTLLFSNICYADSLYETEPNDTISNAQVVQRNNHNPAEFINGNNNSQKVIKGSIDKTDEDWFKVYLPADSNTVLSINSKVYPSFEVYDTNYNLIIPKLTHIHDYDFFGAYPYYLNIPTSGYYYIKVSDNVMSGNYLFTIGSPNYSVGNYKYIANNTLTLTTNTNSIQATYDLRNISSIPNGAVVYDLTIKGKKTNSASSQKRSIKLESDYNWINTSMYSWTAKVPVSMNKLLKSRWKLRLEGRVYSSSSPYVLSPEIQFYYVYPVLPN